MTAFVSKLINGPAWRGNRRETQRGYSMIELVVALSVGGAVMAPVVNAVDQSMVTIQAIQNETNLKTAHEALIRYAAQNDGCLPFAADWEGSLPNTDETGAPGYTDTGIARDNVHAGDLPWTDLGLGDSFRDGDSLRIQYYVATPYADFGSGCVAATRYEHWHQNVTYDGTAISIYLYHTPRGGSLGLYKVDGVLAAGTSPEVGGYSEESESLPDNLLELRRGPDVMAAGTESDVLSAQNVFVLIATGNNINPDTEINLPYMRDENHLYDGVGTSWELNEGEVDDVLFSATHEYNSDDEGASGDDTLLVTSFLSFKSDLRSFGVKLESIY